MMEQDLVILAIRSHGAKIARPIARRLKKLDRAIRASGVMQAKKKSKR
jgi:hypothetical protein